MLFVGCQKAAPVKVDVTKVILDKTEVGVMIDGTTTLSASVEPINAWIQDIVWASDNEAVATVDENGKVKGIATGTAVIKAIAKDNESAFATCTVTVTDKPIHVTGLELNKTKSELYVGEEDLLVVTVLPAIATDQSVVWKSSDETVAVVDGGCVVALAEGSAKITVRSIDGDKTASCNVDVLKREVVLDAPAEMTICVDTLFNVGATVDPDSLEIVYRSDRPFIKVDEEGNVVASQPGEGTITVTVESTDEFEGDEKTVKVVVEPVFAIDEANCSVKNGAINVGKNVSFSSVVFKSWADWTISADDFITILNENAEPISGGKAGTVSIWVGVDENEADAGRTGEITFTAANGEPLGAVSVNQEMFLGYYIYYNDAGRGNLLSVEKVGDDSPYGNYVISGLGYNDGSYWRADFDAVNNVLVCQGYEYGYEVKYGVQFDALYDWYYEPYGWAYGYYCYPDERRSAFNKALKFDIDPATGALTSFAEDCFFAVEVYDVSTNDHAGDYSIVLPGTELVPYYPEPGSKAVSAAPASKASLKADPVMVGRKGVPGPRMK